MNKDEILSKSRKEHTKNDPYTLEIQGIANRIGGLVAIILATLFFILQSIADQGFNFGLYAILLGYGSADFFTKYYYLKKKGYLFFAIIYLILAIVLSVFHIKQLLV
ncbi:DUF6442 family protein [Enterococcus olivae]